MCYPCITYKDLAEHGTGGFGGSGWEGPPFRPNFLYFHVGFGSFGRMLDSTPPPHPSWIRHYGGLIILCNWW